MYGDWDMHGIRQHFLPFMCYGALKVLEVFYHIRSRWIEDCICKLSPQAVKMLVQATVSQLCSSQSPCLHDLNIWLQFELDRISLFGKGAIYDFLAPLE